MVLPEISPDVAVIVVEPAATPLARPVAFTVATDVVPEDQITDAVISCDAPPVRFPVAENCRVSPLARDGFAGVTVID